ncbi:MAG: hypothetical protein JJE30_08855 [Desulfuromonadales bacterium]|nr:hypothetical protein [Desulfuromonadales bacterium]
MADVVKFRVSPAVAAFVRPGVAVEKKLAGIQTAPIMEPSERLTLLFCLMKDADAAVKTAAESAFASVPEDAVLSYIQAAAVHPSLLSELARVHYSKADVADALLNTEQLPLPARQFLQRQQASVPLVPPVQDIPPPEDDAEDVYEESGDAFETPGADLPCAEERMQEDDAGEIEEEGEQFQSKYKIAMVMGISEKIKMALSGDKEWRAILIKDSNKLVSAGVIKNPRITDGEILTILKVGVQNDEIIRLICANKEWVKNYNIRKALILCPKTPLPNALRYLATLNEKDIAGFAKSKNISSVIATQAKRTLLSKKR